MTIAIHKFKEIRLEGGTILNGFPTAGLVSTIVANYLIGALDLDQVGVLDSDDFPPVSMVYANKPKFPARIYADEGLKLAVFLSEFTPPPFLARPIARAMFSYARETGAERIIAPEVIGWAHGDETEPHVFGVGSTDRVRAEMKRLSVTPFRQGMIAGITGVLLNEGKRAEMDVISLIVETRPEMPDARAAARVLEVINRLLPHLEIDVEPLYEQAERVETHIKEMREQAKAMSEKMQPTYPPELYR